MAAGASLKPIHDSLSMTSVVDSTEPVLALMQSKHGFVRPFFSLQSFLISRGTYAKKKRRIRSYFNTQF